LDYSSLNKIRKYHLFSIPFDFSHTEFFAIVSVIILAVFATTFQPSFSEENRNECRIRVSSDQSLDKIEKFIALDNCFGGEKENHLDCMRNIPQDTSLTFVEKKIARQECASKRQSVTVNTDEISKMSKMIIKFCEERLPIYKIVSEMQFYAVAQHPFSRPCVLLYSEPIWNYTGADRPKVLLDFVHEQIHQHLEDTEDERQNSVRDARIKQSRVMMLEDLFIQVIERISYLEKQVLENNEQITSNESIIQEQQKVIDELDKKIKNIVLTSSHSEIKDSTIEEITECIRIAQSKPLSLVDKIKDVQQCAKIDRRDPIEISDQIISRISQKAIKFCNDGYPFFLELSYQDYLDTIKHPVTRECAVLYQHPIWTYEGADREEKIFEIVKEHVKQELEESSDVRKKSVIDALIGNGRIPALVDFFNFFDQRIESLENQVDEQEELIAKQEAILQKHLKDIQILTEKIKNTVLEQNSNLIIKI